MFRLLFALVGFVLLVAAVVLGLRVLLPVPTQAVTIGGAETTMQALSMQVQGAGGEGEVAMPAELDGEQIADTEALQLQPQIAPSALEAQPLAPAEAPELEAALSDEVVVPLATAAPGDSGAPPPPLAIEQRVIELEWPTQFRLGGSAAVRLAFEPLAGGGMQPVAEIEGNRVVATPILLSDRYDTHDAMAVAVVGAPAFTVVPVVPEEQTLQRGQAVEWLWTLSPNEAGDQVIGFSLTVRWIPRSGGAEQVITVWSDTVTVQVGQIFGLTVSQAGVAGAVAAVLGVILEIPFLDSILGFVWRRRPRRRRRERR